MRAAPFPAPRQERSVAVTKWWSLGQRPFAAGAVSSSAASGAKPESTST